MCYEHTTIDIVRTLCAKIDGVPTTEEADTPSGSCEESSESLRYLAAIMQDTNNLSDYELAISVIAREYDLLQDAVDEIRRDAEAQSNQPMIHIYDFRQHDVERYQATYYGQLTLLTKIVARYDEAFEIDNAMDDLLVWYQGRVLLRKHLRKTLDR